MSLRSLFTLLALTSAGCGPDAPDPEAVRLACETGVGDSCGTLALWHETGFFGTKVDSALAVTLYERGCDLGDGRACFRLGTILAEGQGTETDAPRAATLFGSGCEAGAIPACYALGELYDTGEGVPRDTARSRELFAQTCELAGLGCSRVAVSDTVEEDRPDWTARHSVYLYPPQILNRGSIVDAVAREYPPTLRATGVTGTVFVYFLLDDQGRTLDTRVGKSSGVQELDAAALRVAETFRFSPARMRFIDWTSWVSLPITFQIESCYASYYQRPCESS